MAVWLVASASVLLWLVAGLLVLRAQRRQGRSLREGAIRRALHEMYANGPEVEMLMAEAPDDPVPAIRHAMFAETAQDWPELAVRAEAVVQRFPEIMFGHLLLARACWHTDRPERSRVIIARARRRFPEAMDIQELEVIQARGGRDWRRAARLGGRMRREHPMLPNGYIHEAQSLLADGRAEAALRVVRLAEIEFPDAAFVAGLWEELAAAEAAG